jgi:predicted dehydrogenase
MQRNGSANDSVSVALMGVRGRGQSMARYFGSLPDVRIPFICDVDPSVVGPASAIVTEMKGKTPVLVPDLRRILDNKGVDAVVMATPIHWHAAGTILACQAGKDVYVEKPASHNIREGRMMVNAARRHKRIVQLGTQSRSRPVTERFIAYVQSGKLGRVLAAKVGNVQPRKNIGHLADEPVPPGLDYDTWTGPVPMMPFNRNRFHGTVNWHWHYGCGDIGNDGVHFLDVARWALNVEYPSEITGMGRKIYFDDDQQTPDTHNVTFNYPDQVIHFEQRLWNSYRMEGSENSVYVYGSDGMAVTGRWDGGKYEFRVYDAKGKLVHADKEEKADDNYHARNFIDSVRTRKMPNADIERGHVSTVLCHLGNIVARTGRAIRFDGKTESVIGDAEANRLVGREYRRHWSTPSA